MKLDITTDKSEAEYFKEDCYLTSGYRRRKIVVIGDIHVRNK